MILRPYQQEASDAAIAWMKQSTDACLIDAAPAAGKSFIIADVARRLHDISGGKKVLCLAPSSELVHQNHEKFLMTGNPASIFSASAGKKCTRHNVVYATPGTAKNGIRRFASEYCAVVVDECHGITNTVQYIIEQMREANPRLRVLGLSGTPFRLKDGYVYRMEEDGRLLSESVAANPYFVKCVKKIPARLMLEQGFLCPMVIGDIGAEGYDASGLLPNGAGKFNDDEIDRAFVGHGRKTAAIVGDVIAKSKGRHGGVMLFASTVQHAQEVMASLPPSISGMITGATGSEERNRIIRLYRERKIRYLVSVGTLTTGFDVEHTEVIALLRKTESASLLQQIMGRAWRLWVGKINALLLDYGCNIEAHFPDGDIYQPEIKAAYQGEKSGEIIASCPDCGIENTFSARKNDEGFNVDPNGYFTDLSGAQIMTDNGPMPAHYGRRCMGLALVAGQHRQCDYRWTSKKCFACDADNDIAARYCKECRAEIIDPGAKLQIDFKRFKKDPTQIQTDRVISWDKRTTMSRAGNECLRVDFVTEYRQFSFWFKPDAEKGKAFADWKQFADATNGGEVMPETVTYKKDGDSAFYRIFGYNRRADEVPELA